MADAVPASLLARANTVFRLAISQPAEGRRQAELVAAEAAESAADDGPEARVVALRGAAWAARELFDHQAAKQLIEEAVSIARRHSLVHRLSECLLTRSTIHLEHGRQKEARADLAAAAAIAPPEVGAEIAMSMSVIEQKAGMYTSALQSYREALRLAGDDQDDVRFKALSNGAICASRLSRHAEAARMIDAAIDVAKRSSAVYLAHATHNRAVLAAERGNPTTALQYFDEALDLWNRANLLPAEHYLEKAETFLALRLLDEADAAIAAALDDLDGRTGAALLYCEGLLLAAVIAGHRGDTDKSIELNERAAAIFASQDRRGWWAVAAQAAIAARLAGGDPSPDDRATIDRIEYELVRAGNLSGQIAAALTSARLARRDGDHAAAARAYRWCADAGRRGSALQRIQRWVAATEQADMEGDGRRVSSAARAGLRTLDNYRAAFDAIELRARAATYGESLASHGLRWAVAGRRPDQVWFWLERTRAAALIEPARSEGDGASVGEDTEEALGRLRAAAANVTKLGPEAEDGLAAQRDLARAEQAIRALSWQRDRMLSARPGDAEPTLGRSPTHASLERIRADLGDTGLVQYGVVDGELIAVVVTSDRRRFLSLCRADDAAAAMRQTAFALRRLGRARAGDAGRADVAAADAALGRLDQLLTAAAVRETVGRCAELVIVPPSDMIGVPWAGLPTFAGRPLMVVPSATAWWVTGRRRPPAVGRTVAFAGPNLRHAAEEVQRIAACHPDSIAFVDHLATCSTFAEQINGAGTVHVAAHGRLRSDSPTFSSFELVDGPFTVHDIQRVKDPPRRWILAACDLGSPGSLSGPDLEGIVAALFSGGAGAVVAAVVPVPDSSTPKLMVALHERLGRGASTARALHEARAELDPGDPLDRLAQVAFASFGAQ